MRAFLGILFLLGAIACGWAVFLVEETGVKLVCIVGVFGGGVFYGILLGGGGKR